MNVMDTLKATIASHTYGLETLPGSSLSVGIVGMETPVLLIFELTGEDGETVGERAIEYASEGIDYTMYRTYLTRSWWNVMVKAGEEKIVEETVNRTINVVLGEKNVHVAKVDDKVYGMMLDYEPIWHHQAIHHLEEAGVSHLVHFALSPVRLDMFFVSPTTVLDDKVSKPIASLVVSNGTTGHVAFSWSMAILSSDLKRSFSFHFRHGRKLHLKGTTESTITQVKEAIESGVVEAIQTAMDTMEVQMPKVLLHLKSAGYKVDSKRYEALNDLGAVVTLGTIVDALMNIDPNAAQTVFNFYSHLITF